MADHDDLILDHAGLNAKASFGSCTLGAQSSRLLSDVLSDANVPHDFDVLSIDIKGVDIEVFYDLIKTSHYRPRYTIVEALHGRTIPLQDIGLGTTCCAPIVNWSGRFPM